MYRIPASAVPMLQSTEINDPSPNPAAAAAPGRALSTVGDALDGLGAHFAHLSERARVSQQSAIISEKRSGYRRAWAEKQVELDKLSDPQERIAQTQQFFTDQLAGLDDPGLGDEAKQRLREHFNEFADAAYIAQHAQAYELGRKRLRLATENELDMATKARSPKQVREALDNAVAGGALLPEERVKIETEIADGWQQQDRQREALQNPRGYIDAYRETPPPGATPSQWQAELSAARTSLARKTAEISTTIQDGIVTGTIKDDADIDRLAPELTPSARSVLKRDLAQWGLAKTRAQLADPGYQAAVVGRAAELLETYTVDSDGFDEKLVEIDSLLRRLPENNAAGAELKRQLKMRLEGQQRVIESNADLARAALSDMRAAGIFGTGKTTLSIDKLLEAGILRDPVKLTKRGLSPDQAAAVLNEEADAGDLEKLGVPKGDAERIAGMKGEEGRIARFRALARNKTGLDRSTPFDAKAYEMLESGKTGAVEVPDLAARETARRRYGKAVATLNDWLKTHPNARDEEQAAKLKEIARQAGIPGAVDAVLESIIQDLNDNPDGTQAGDILPPYPED